MSDEMKMVAAKIDHLGRLAVLFDCEPAPANLTYQAHPYMHDAKPGTAFYAQNAAGLVDFMVETDDHTGSYGREIELTLTDGTTHTAVGPWSSNPEFIRSVVPGADIYTGQDVSVYTDPFGYEQASGGWAYYITHDAAREAHALAALHQHRPTMSADTSTTPSAGCASAREV